MNIFIFYKLSEDVESKRKCDGVSGQQGFISVSLHSADGETLHTSDLQRICVVPNTVWTFRHAAVLWQTLHSRLHKV